MLTSLEYRQQLEENGKRLVSRRYTWKAIASDFNCIYGSILDQPPLPKSPVFD
ncbi:MAG TPA: hypothetical protein V6D35_08225 [Candidatus Sericytochromatia bacterium]